MSLNFDEDEKPKADDVSEERFAFGMAPGEPLNKDTLVRQIQDAVYDAYKADVAKKLRTSAKSDAKNEHRATKQEKRCKSMSSEIDPFLLHEQMAATAQKSRADIQKHCLSLRDPKKIVYDWLEDGAKKNGKRPHTCTTCKHPFLGNKKRKECFDCAVTVHTVHIPIPSYEDKEDEVTPD